MTIVKKLYATIGIILFAMILLGLYGLQQLNRAEFRSDYVQNSLLPAMNTLSTARDALEKVRLNGYRYIVSRPADRPAVYQEIKTYDTALDTAIDHYATVDGVYGPHDVDAMGATVVAKAQQNDNELIAEERVSLKEYRDLRSKMFDVVDKPDSFYPVYEQYKTKAGELKDIFDKHVELNKAQIKDQGDRNVVAYAASVKLISGVIFVFFAAAGVLATVLVMEIKTGLNGLQDKIKEISDTKDFTKRVEVKKKNEIGVTATAFNELLDSILKSLHGIRTGATSVGTASRELDTGAIEVSRASREQAEASSAIAATVEELTVSINHVGEQAGLTRETAKRSGDLARQGKAAIDAILSDFHRILTDIGETASEITTLSNHSTKIAEIVTVINEVAEQTNLLALNAAIEAARAGESGRGFAVVADEVKKLALRTAKSSKEIHEVVKIIQEQTKVATTKMLETEGLVRESVQRADDTSGVMIEIESGAARTADMVVEITTAITQQASASTNIAQQVERGAQMAEESSASAAATSANASMLDKLARSQLDVVSQYKIE